MKTSAAIIVSALLATAGCHRQPAAPAAAMANSPGIVVSQARVVLPAVKGNPGAGYFTLGNENSQPTTLVSVTITGAQKTEMHQTSGGTMAPLPSVRIDPGQRVIFAPGGKHVMAFNLAPSLSPGGSSEIEFHFLDGKTTSAPLRVEAPGGGTSTGMDGMTMPAKP